MEYLGVAGTEDYAYVLVRKWMPVWDRWAESKFQVKSGQKIGIMTAVARRRLQSLAWRREPGPAC